MRSWLLWTLLAVACWGPWAVIGKLIGLTVTPMQSQALSTLGMIPVILALGWSQKWKLAGNRRGVWLALVAGALACLGNTAYYDALNHGEVATVVPLTALYPLITVLLAFVFLKEKMNLVQITGVVLSLGAIYFFNVEIDHKGLISPWLLVALIPMALWGVSGLVQKIATNHISGELSSFWFLLAFVPLGVFLYLRDPLTAPVSQRTWILTISLGLTMALGNFALLVAFARGGKASVISPIAGLYPLVSIAIIVLGFGVHVGPRESIGIVLALLAVVALAMESPGAELKK